MLPSENVRTESKRNPCAGQGRSVPQSVKVSFGGRYSYCNVPARARVDSFRPQKSPSGVPMHWRGQVDADQCPLTHDLRCVASTHCVSPSRHSIASTHWAPVVPIVQTSSDLHDTI